MGKILVIDDTPFWRDIAADVLRNKGHTVFTADDGVDGLVSLRANGADLIILDVEMPRLTGFSFLDQLRLDAQWKNLPVIMLTGDMQKEDILRAKKMGAVDYVLKARFDVPTLLDRVQKRLASTGAAQISVPPSMPLVQKADELPQASDKTGSLLTREQSIERAEQAMDGRALSGVAAKVIAYVGSARMDLSELADLIRRDSMLTVRVLQTANSAAYTSNRGVISTIAEAVRIVGSAAIRDIAASFAIFEAMPATEPDGFNVIQGWQQSLAVAMLCNHLAAEDQRGLAYVVGLCHNLGEILFRTHFGVEYRQVLDAEKATSMPRRELEQRMLGITHGELVEKILEKLELPPVIRRPIIAFHHPSGQAGTDEPLARMLQLADRYAIAIMLRSSDQAVLQPVTRVECRSATGTEDPPPPIGDDFRSELVSMTAMYARLPASQQMEMTKGLQKRKPVRVCLVREATLSTLDPVAAALDGLCEISICTSLPTPAKLAEYRGLIVLARNSVVHGFTAQDIASLFTESNATQVPTLWLVGRKSDNLAVKPGDRVPLVWPVSLNILADFVQKL